METMGNEWGSWNTWVAKKMVPIFYYRIWHKMGNAVMEDNNCTEPLPCLQRAIRHWSAKRKGKRFFGGNAEPNMIDIWLYGQLVVMKDETIYDQAIIDQDTKQWMSRMEELM